jgi:hypothetical protein
MIRKYGTCSLAFLGLMNLCPQVVSPTKIVTAKQVNGTWKGPQGIFKIWALGNQRLQIEFFLSWTHQSKMGPVTNTGDGRGTAFIEGDTATLKPEESESNCTITLRFKNGLLEVSESGDCGFGFNVSANGTCKKISSKRPVFAN